MDENAFRDRLGARWARHVPTRDQLLANKWLRPFARHLSEPAIWRWNRRAVARGAALGMFITIAIPLPVQIFLSAVLAVFARANVFVAVLCAFFSNPFTTPAILAAAYGTGRFMLAIDDKFAPAMEGSSVQMLERLANFLAEASLPVAVGLLALATVASTASYAGVHLFWRARVGRRWARRSRVRKAARTQ